MKYAWAVVGFVVVGACGGATTLETDDSGTKKDAGKLPGCPTSLPQSGGACPREGLVCQYPQGGHSACYDQAMCSGGKWLVAQPNCAPATCPATRDQAVGQLCTPSGARCDYDGMLCECSNCTTKYPVAQCGGPDKWQCEAPNPTPGCPAGRPLLGVACTSEGLFCDYGCEKDVSRKCDGGVWISASSPYGCPASTRTVKKDIHYLSDEERARIARDALALKIATYKYRDPAIAKRTHLGVILEDAPDSYSSDMDRLEVDLYSYATMSLALSQQQEREIAQLRADVKALKETCGKKESAR